MTKILLFIFCLIPLFYYGFDLFDSAEPVKYLIHSSGNSAILMILFSLICSLFYRFYKNKNLIIARKMLGIFGFFYAFLHILIYILLESNFEFTEFVKRKYIFLGMLSFLILAVMTITSFGRLKIYIKPLHKLIYPAFILMIIHSVLSQKIPSDLTHFFAFSFLILILIKLYQHFFTRFKL